MTVPQYRTYNGEPAAVAEIGRAIWAQLNL
jgi:hypothetical protein